MNSRELCQFLDWDSDFFHKRIARINPNNLTPEEFDSVMAWCTRESIECLYYLADSTHTTSIGLAENNNFHLVDIRVTFEVQLQMPQNIPQESPSYIREFHQEDMASLCEIARTNHRDTRFYSDLHFQRELCDSLYETWIEKSCNGYADEVLVVDAQEGACGYITCHLKENLEGQIGLVGLHPTCQGRGYGRNLINEALKWFLNQGVHRVEVVTQGRNYRAQKLYQRCGFTTSLIQLWYHRWF